MAYTWSAASNERPGHPTNDVDLSATVEALQVALTRRTRSVVELQRYLNKQEDGGASVVPIAAVRMCLGKTTAERLDAL